MGSEPAVDHYQRYLILGLFVFDFNINGRVLSALYLQQFLVSRYFLRTDCSSEWRCFSDEPVTSCLSPACRPRSSYSACQTHRPCSASMEDASNRPSIGLLWQFHTPISYYFLTI